MRENETEAGKVRWVLWVRPDRPDDVGGPVGRRWGRPDKDGDGWTKMGTNPDRFGLGLGVYESVWESVYSTVAAV